MASEVPRRLHNVTIFPIDSGGSEPSLLSTWMGDGLMISKADQGAFFHGAAGAMMILEKVVYGK